MPEVVFRSIYTEMNARLQLQATQLEGPIEFLSDEEGKRSSANRGTLERPWELWKKEPSARTRDKRSDLMRGLSHSPVEGLLRPVSLSWPDTPLEKR